ncbi:MAG: hypothetical protein WCI73_14040 [Phycisphaerae bacterium]
MMLFNLVVLSLIGCQLTADPTVAALGQAEDHAAGISGKVGAAATQATSAGQAVVQTAQEGSAKTPPADKALLDPYWLRLLGLGQGIIAQGDVLQGIRADIDALKGEVKQGKLDLAAALDAVAREKSARAEDAKTFEKKLAEANSAWARMFRTVAWLAIAAIGIAVTVGVLLKDYRISIAGGAGGGATLLACMIAGQLEHWLPWVAGGLVAVVVLWVGIETLLRGSLAAALKTTPLQDIEDALHIGTPAAVGAGVPAPLGPGK